MEHFPPKFQFGVEGEKYTNVTRGEDVDEVEKRIIGLVTSLIYYLVSVC